jgi:HEAT repeat protein
VSLQRDLVSPDAGIRLRAAREAAHRAAFEAGEATALLALLGDGDRRVQRAAAESLAAVADRVAELDRHLGQSLASQFLDLRWGAAFCLACLGRPPLQALDIWVDRLASAESDLRWAAHDLIVRWIAELGEAALARLYAAADDANSQRRKMALYCLRDLGVEDSEAERLAYAALDHDETGVRLAALAALPRVAADRRAAARAVCGYLQDSDVAMRRAAAAALANLDWEAEPEVRHALEAAARSSDAGLRRAAARTLARRR